MHKYVIQPGEPFEGFGFATGPDRIGKIRNSNASNSHVPPHDLVQYKKVFLDDGIEDTWGEYIPTTYDGSQPVPLIVCIHAGGGRAETIFDDTSWAILAEQEGFICVYPNSIVPGMWLGDPTPGADTGPRGNSALKLMDSPTGTAEEDSHDILFVCALIEEMKQKYNIDAGRIYMQGMSMGDIMTMQFSRLRGDLLAGAGNTAGPSPEQALFTEDGEVKKHRCPVPVYQARGELDTIAINGGYKGDLDRWGINSRNRDFWKKVNGCTAPPSLAIRDVNNFAFYRGEKADLYYRDVKYRAHGQTLDDSVIMWRQMFSGTRRMPDGTIQRTEPQETDFVDCNAAALCVGCSNVLLDNKVAALGAPVEMKTLTNIPMGPPMQGGGGPPKPETLLEILYVPLSFFELYYKAKVQLDGRRAEIIFPDGRVCQVAENSVGCMADNVFRAMSRQAEWLNDQLYLPVQWFAVNLFKQYATQCEGSLYLSDHYGVMTIDMAQIIRETLA